MLLRRKRARIGSEWHLNEAFITMNGAQYYLGRAVDPYEAVIDIRIQPRRKTRRFTPSLKPFIL
jgi:putative transposase